MSYSYNDYRCLHYVVSVWTFRPDAELLETVCWFPMIYYLLGSIDRQETFLWNIIMFVCNLPSNNTFFLELTEVLLAKYKTQISLWQLDYLKLHQTLPNVLLKSICLSVCVCISLQPGWPAALWCLICCQYGGCWQGEHHER